MRHALTYDAARRRVVLFGGDLLDGTSAADTWAWDGDYWTQVADTGPNPRSGHGLAFDTNFAAVVLFGGSSSSGELHGDTWLWDGSDWTQVADTGPSARTAHALAYDAARSRLVLFGGEAAALALQGDTWEWDGQDWTQLQDIGPDPRRHHAMAFDPGRGRTVLFGGDVGSGTASDTWEWDGSSWAQVQDIGPGPCAAGAAAFDGSAVLLFGGVASLAAAALAPAVSGLTWEWDGNDWTLRQNMGPRPRWGHALAFDSDRSTVVLFGGLPVAPPSAASASDLLQDTWEARPPAAPAAPGIIFAVRLDPDTVAAGGTTQLFVDLAQPAPAGGVVFAISAPWGAGQPVATMTMQPGTTTGQTSLVAPGSIAAGDYAIEARAGASVAIATLHIVVVGPTLVSFTLTDNTLSAFGALVAEMVVELDQPAPAGGVVVDVRHNGNDLVDVHVPAGSTVGTVSYHLHGQLATIGVYTLVAQLGTSIRTTTLHIGPF
jgi:hypothetical protein